MTDLLACLTRLTNFIISLTEGINEEEEEEEEEESERWDNDGGMRAAIWTAK